MKTNRIARGLVALSAALALTACGTSLGSIADVGATTSSGTTSSAVATTATDGSYTIHAQADDVDYDASTAKTIALRIGQRRDHRAGHLHPHRDTEQRPGHRQQLRRGQGADRPVERLHHELFRRGDRRACRRRGRRRARRGDEQLVDRRVRLTPAARTQRMLPSSRWPTSPSAAPARSSSPATPPTGSPPRTDWSSSAGPSRSRPPTTASGARTTW